MKIWKVIFNLLHLVAFAVEYSFVVPKLGGSSGL